MSAVTISIGFALRREKETAPQLQLNMAQKVAGLAQNVFEVSLSLTLTCSVKANAEGRLFGSVSPADVLAKLAEAGIVLPKKQLAMYEAFKSLGEHEAPVQLHPEVRGKLRVKVVAEKAPAATADAE